MRTLPQLLKGAGYRTALVGKKHILPDDALPFDEELAPERPGHRDVAFMAGEARKFIARSGDQPFLLVVGYSDPHRAEQNFGNTRTVAANRARDLRSGQGHRAGPSAGSARSAPRPGGLLSVDQSARQRDRVAARRCSRNPAQRRHAGHLSERQRRPFPGGKTTLYDDGIHLPLIVSSPTQGKRGVRNNAMVSWVDIAPTMLDWAGCHHRNAAARGPVGLPILEQSDPQGWDRVFASHVFHEIQQYYPMRALRTRQYKYIVNLAAPLEFPIAGDIAASPTWRAMAARPSVGLGARTLQAFLHRPSEELYDLRKDPAEVKNLAGDPAHRAVLERMRAELTTFRTDTGDPWLTITVTKTLRRSHPRFAAFVGTIPRATVHCRSSLLRDLTCR